MVQRKDINALTVRCDILGILGISVMTGATTDGG